MANITLLNRTTELVRLAVYMKPAANPALASIAWIIASPPPGGQQIIDVPSAFEVQARYSPDPERPAELSCTTASVAFQAPAARFTIDAASSPDDGAGAAVIEQRFTDLVANQVRVVNRYPLGCQVSLCKEGRPVLAPQVVWPGGLLVADLQSPLFVALIAGFNAEGPCLVDEEIQQTQVEVSNGSIVSVSGSIWTGYTLSLS